MIETKIEEKPSTFMVLQDNGLEECPPDRPPDRPGRDGQGIEGIEGIMPAL